MLQIIGLCAAYHKQRIGISIWSAGIYPRFLAAAGVRLTAIFDRERKRKRE
jgi:hypothetical protein